MATKPKRTAQEIAARKRALARALDLNAERLKREQELTGLAADFLMTRELETDVLAALEEEIAGLRAVAEAECGRLRRQGASVVALLVARGEGAGRIAQRLGLGVGEVRQLRDDAASRVQEAAAGRGGAGSAKMTATGPGGAVAGASVAGGSGASWGGVEVSGVDGVRRGAAGGV
ncbi:hypothetical protein [Streptomyces sp. NPDC001933]|uniref:hypothetical protein n=1 Tax=Streptomyces sp. NPDC001933 TaxID=3364626 RepID=UPI0036AF8B78